MINIKSSGINSVILTLTEKESQIFTYDGPLYKLDLLNQFLNKLVSNIQIADVSLNTPRYNEFKIVSAELLNSFTFTENITLESDRFYFVDADFVVETGVNVTIPVNTYVVMGTSRQILNDGTITNVENVIFDVSIDINKDWWIFTNQGSPVINVGSPPEDKFVATYLLNFLSGYYDYTAKSDNETKQLEIGKVLIDAPIPTTFTYSNNNTENYTYNG